MFQYRNGARQSTLFPFEFVLNVEIGKLEWKESWRRLDEAVEWCRDQFGSTHEGNWYCEDGIMTIYFKKPLDAVAFRLRWC